MSCDEDAARADALALYHALLSADDETGRMVLSSTPCLACLAQFAVIIGLSLVEFAAGEAQVFSPELRPGLLAALEGMVASSP